MKKLLVLFCLLFGCSSHWTEAPRIYPQEDSAPTTPAKPPDFTLSNAPPKNQAATLSTSQPFIPSATTPLSANEVSLLLSRLPALPKEKPLSFYLQKESLPPPKTSTTVTATFPNKDSLAQPEPTEDKKTLELLRYTTPGETEYNKELTLVFSRSMVPLTTISALEASEVPVKLTPQPKGKWRWVGTKILSFTPDEAWPKATEYTVEFPVGEPTENVKAQDFRFYTNPARVAGAYPSQEKVGPQPLLFFSFNQQIDPSKVLAVTHAEAGRKEVALRLASPEEIAKDSQVNKLYASTQNGTAMVITPEKPLPPDTKVMVKVGPNIPSAEGSRTEEVGQSMQFETYGPLKIVEKDCAYELRCKPSSWFTFRFNNKLDKSSITQEQIKVEPSFPGMQISISDYSIDVTGTKPLGKYKVTLPAGIKDIYGQKIEKEISESFRVRPQRSSSNEGYLHLSLNDVVVFTPEQSKKIPVYTTDLSSFRVSYYEVDPKDWNSAAYQSRYRAPLGKKILSEVIEVKNVDGESSATTEVDISKALSGAFGHVLVEFEERELKKEDKSRSFVWVQVTNVGIDTFQDGDSLRIFVSSLKDGAAIEGAEVSLSSGGEATYTDKEGMAKITWPLADQAFVAVKKDADSAFLPGLSVMKPLPRELRWFVTDGRNLYRPGEEVKLKGWLRLKDDELLRPASEVAKELSYTVKDSLGNDITKGRSPLDENGGFDLSFKLPETTNLGNASVEFSVPNAAKELAKSSFNFAFNIQEFRRPEFEVKAEFDAEPAFFGDSFTATATASYFSGGGLPEAKVQWSLNSRETNFIPPKRSDFSFGASRYYGEEQGPYYSSSWKATTDISGEHALQVSFSKDAGVYPRVISGEAYITDVNRQAFQESLSKIVHPASVYVGLKTKLPFTQTREAQEIEAIVVNLDGEPVEGRKITFSSGRVVWEDTKQKLTEVELCEEFSSKEKVSCTFKPSKSGLYQITASVKDDKGRESRTQILRYVISKDATGEELIEKRAKLLTNKESYKAGDTAELLVFSPFIPAEGVLTLQHGGIVKTERFRMSGPSQIIKVPVPNNLYPTIKARVDLVGVAPMLDKQIAPAYATASTLLYVPATEKKLSVEVLPKEPALTPGAKTSVDVVLKDSDGKIAQGEVALFVVDESLLALSGFRMPSPIDVFYAAPSDNFTVQKLREKIFIPGGRQDLNQTYEVYNGISTGRSFQSVVSVMPGVAADGFRGNRYRVDGLDITTKADKTIDTSSKIQGGSFRPQGTRGETFGAFAGNIGPQAAQPLAVRASFESTAIFVARSKTDTNGKTSISYQLPESLTRYRIMAVAASGTGLFGTGESSVTARLPLMVRPSPPRFLLQGDQAEVSVVVQNQSEKATTVDIALRASLTSLLEGKGYHIEIPPNGRREIRFPLQATEAGKATIQVAARAGEQEDAAQVSLPVYTPATTEAFAAYGELDEGTISQAVTVGDDVSPDFGALDITTSSTALSSLTDAVIYLNSYPYECSEQLASRILAISALRGFLREFKAEGLPSAEELNAAVERDIKKLSELQNYEGGFGFFRQDEEAWPYVSVHVAHALVRAKAAGFSVPSSMLEKSKYHLQNINYFFRRQHSDAEKNAVEAYAVYVLQQMGESSPLKVRQLSKDLDKLPLEAIGWLLPSLEKQEAEAVIKLLNKKAKETAGAAHFSDTYESGAYLVLASSRRTDAVLLEALIQISPKSELIPKLAAGLLAHRTKGRWSSTQENTFVLLALKKYFETYEKASPNFIARAWLGDTYAGDHSFKGRTIEQSKIEIPMKELVSRKESSLLLSKEGPGRMYYRLGLFYAPKTMSFPPLQMGFEVERRYEAIDDPGDVVQNKDGSWTIKAGARVQVKISIFSPSERYHVALVDSMPAGFEAERLALTQRSPWYQHQNIRDERVEAFTTYLYAGAYSYSYIARATTPGIFIAPPAKAEEMYSPEVFGRSALEKVIVVE